MSPKELPNVGVRGAEDFMCLLTYPRYNVRPRATVWTVDCNQRSVTAVYSDVSTTYVTVPNDLSSVERTSDCNSGDNVRVAIF